MDETTDNGRLRFVLTLFAAVELGALGWAPVWLLNGMLLATAVAVVPALGTARGWPRAGVGLIAIAAGWAAEVHGPGGSWTLFGLLVAVFAGTSGERRSGGLASLAAVAVLGVALRTPLGHRTEELLSGALSAIAGPLVPGALDLGPVYSGLRLGLAAVIVMVLLPSSGAARLGRASAVVAGVAVSSAAAVGWTAALLPPFGSGEGGDSGRILAASLPWIPLAAWSLCARRVSFGASSLSSRPLRVAAGLALAWGTAALVAPHAGSDPRPREVAIYDKGLVSWGVPEPDNYGEYSAGMMGTLPQFHRALGANAELVPDLSAERLAERDTLVIVNLDHELPPDELRATVDWVHAGGRLILLGDHTFLEETDAGHRLILNDVLAGSDVAFINDSADQLLPGWNHATTAFGLEATLRCEPDNPSGMLVGGSLRLGRRAAPIQIGRFGYSDLGVDEPAPGGKAYLGDLLWNRGERLGGVVGAAWSPAGDGLVLAIADTTGGTNLGRVFRWEWWSEVLSLDCLPDRRSHWTAVGCSLASLLVLVLAAFRPAFRSWSPLVAGGLIAATPWLLRIDRPTPLAEAPSHVQLALVDLNGAPAGRTPSWESDGAMSLAVGVQRNGWLPVMEAEAPPELIERADLILWPGAQIAPSRAHVDRVLARVEQGATLILAAGNLERHAYAEFFERVEAWIAPQVFQGQGASWVNGAGPGSVPFLPEPWWLGGSEQWLPRLIAGDRMVTGERKWGRGRIVIVSDPFFLTNYAQEGKWGHNLGNLEALHHLITEPAFIGGA